MYANIGLRNTHLPILKCNLRYVSLQMARGIKIWFQGARVGNFQANLYIRPQNHSWAGNIRIIFADRKKNEKEIRKKKIWVEIDDGCTEARALEYMEGKRHAGNRMEDFYILLRGIINNHFRFIVFYATITLTVRVHSPISRCFCFNITAWAYGAYCTSLSSRSVRMEEEWWKASKASRHNLVNTFRHTVTGRRHLKFTAKILVRIKYWYKVFWRYVMFFPNLFFPVRDIWTPTWLLHVSLFQLIKKLFSKNTLPYMVQT